jgi:NSS family neurotransmitter:Na+ symporter
MRQRRSSQGQWSSRIAFVLAAAGSAIGLGSIWRFPFVAGENGGGSFVVAYLAAVLLVGLPLLVAEVMLGRRGRRNPISAMATLSEEEAGHAGWRWSGVLGVVTGLLILSYYSVIAGWTLAYALPVIGDAGVATDAASARIAFDAMRGNLLEVAFCHTIFLGTAAWIVGRGVEEGLERAVTFAMPLLLSLLLGLVVWALTHGDAARAVDYLFQRQAVAVDAPLLLAALGQVFFTLSIGMGALMAYGAYLPGDIKITGAALVVVGANSVVSLLAGLVIFPLVFEHGVDPATGPGLVFATLPLAFGGMPAGAAFGTLFFALLVIAALGSAIALLEPAVAWAIESRKLSRPRAAFAVAGAVWLLGIPAATSFNLFAGVELFGLSLFDLVEHGTSQVLLPLSGLCLAVFAGWVMCRSSSVEELDVGVGSRYQAWRFLIRWVTPGVLLAVGVLALFARARA